MNRILFVIIILAAILALAGCKVKTEQTEEPAAKTEQAAETKGDQLGSLNSADKWLDKYEQIIASFEKKSSLTEQELTDLEAKLEELGQKGESQEAKLWTSEQHKKLMDLTMRLTKLMYRFKGM